MYGLYASNIKHHQVNLVGIDPGHLRRPIRVHQYGNPIPLVKTQQVADGCQAEVKLCSANDPSRWERAPNDHTMVFKRPDLRNLSKRLLQKAAYSGEHRAVRLHGSSAKHPHIGCEKIANHRPCFSMTFLRPIPRTIGYSEECCQCFVHSDSIYHSYESKKSIRKKCIHRFYFL